VPFLERVTRMERAIQAYVLQEILKTFSEYSLVAINESLPGRIRADFHFKDPGGTDVFVEASARKIGRTKLNRILNLYAAISNIEPPLGKFELIVIGPDVTSSVRKQLQKLPIRLHTYEEIGITRQKLREVQEQERRRLSPEEARLIAKWESERKATIRVSDVQEALRCKPSYASFLLHNLERKQWLERVARGLYQFIPVGYGYPERIPPSDPFVIGAALIKPYYFSYYTSNSHYGFTTQMPFTLFIATTRKKSDLEWSRSTFKFVTLSRRKFFGYRKEKVFDTEVNMADPEKSLVDSFDKPRYAGGTEQLARIAWRAFPRINKEKLVDYAVRMHSHALIQRLGFVLDFLSKEDLVNPIPRNMKNEMLKHVGQTTIYLDSRRPKRGEYSRQWKVINNVRRAQLLSEIEIG